MKKKKGFKKEKRRVIFDENERTDYLTGFHKRKLARKLKAKEKLDNLLKEEKKRIKQNQREALQNALYTQRQVPEIEHLLKPVTYDLPDHTVTISEFQDWNSVPVTSSLHVTQDDLVSKSRKDVGEVEKVRKLIRDLKSKRVKTLKSSSTQLAAKKRQKKLDRTKGKKIQRQISRSSKHTKKKNKKKSSK